MAGLFTRRWQTMGTMFAEVLFRMLIVYAALVAFFNPFGISISHWVAKTVGKNLDVVVADYWTRATTWSFTPMEYGLTALAVFVIALTVYALLSFRGWKRSAFIMLVAGGAFALLIMAGMGPAQTFLLLIMVGALSYFVYCVPRYLGFVGSVFVLGLAAVVIWGLANAGLFDFTSGLLIQWTAIVILGFMFGLASSTGFITRWWQGRTPVEDVDTQSLNEHHQSEHLAPDNHH